LESPAEVSVKNVIRPDEITKNVQEAEHTVLKQRFQLNAQ